MEVRCTRNRPSWATGPGKSYETEYLYTGLGRINLHTQTFQLLQTIENSHNFLFTERPHPVGVLSRVYHVEHVTYTEYSESPRRWSEQTDPSTVMFFAEVRRNVPEKR